LIITYHNLYKLYLHFRFNELFDFVLLLRSIIAQSKACLHNIVLPNDLLIDFGTNMLAAYEKLTLLLNSIISNAFVITQQPDPIVAVNNQYG